MNILYFLVLPIITILFKSTYINNAYVFCGYLLFVIISFCASCILFFILNKKTNINYKNMAILVSIFVGIDQLIKFIVYKFNIEFKIIGSLVKIKQRKNMEQIGALNFLKIEWNYIAIIVFKLIMIIVVVCIFILIKDKNNMVKIAFILICSAAIAHLLDSLLWGYTLDYVYFYNLHCYDLKDFYVDAFVGIIFKLKIDELIREEKDRIQNLSSVE